MRRALLASAAAHLAVLAALLALAHPRFQAAPAMRVALVGQPGTAAGPDGTPETAGGMRPGEARAERARPVMDPGPAAPAPPQPSRATPVVDPGAAALAPRSASRSSTRATRPAETKSSGADQSGDGAALGAEALVSAVQSDVWVLAGSAPPAKGTARAGVSSAGGAGPAGGVSGTGPTPGAGAQDPASGDGTGAEAPGGQSSASLLAQLSQRLAWSAARCAPAEVVRTARHAVPGVPLHFCLDAAGQPSDVGLLGTTGSDLLDRAARDCVVPGALPLPPVPGCYTVEVRFPTRG